MVDTEKHVWKASSLALAHKFKKLELNPEIPTYYVHSLGQCEIDKPEETDEADYRKKLVSQICKEARQHRKHLRRVEISVSWHGIEIIDAKSNEEELVPIYLICRGMTDMEKPRIFAYLSQNLSTKKLECHAFVCNKPKTSWAMTLSLKRSFEVAYEEWKAEQRRKPKFYNDKFLKLAEDLEKVRDENNDENGNQEKTKECKSNFSQPNVDTSYMPRTKWTKFEEDLMAPQSFLGSFGKRKKSSRRLPSVREVIRQPAVDNMFQERQQLTSYASVFDVGDNEGLHRVVQDDDVQMMSLIGMDPKEANGLSVVTHEELVNFE